MGRVWIMGRRNQVGRGKKLGNRISEWGFERRGSVRGSSWIRRKERKEGGGLLENKEFNVPAVGL